MTATEGEQVALPTIDQLTHAGLNAWRHGWDMTARYWEAVARARTLTDIVVAQADFFTDGAARFFSIAGKPTETLTQTLPD